MKKIIVLLFSLMIVLVGCGQKENSTVTKKEESKTIEKIDKSKDYVYLTKFTNLIIWNVERNIDILTINLKSDDVNKINSEINKFVVDSVNDYQVYANTLVQGNVIDYDYYVSDNYISVIMRYYLTSDDMVGDKHEKVYVVSLDKGTKLSNEDILKAFNITEEELYSKVQGKLKQDEIDESMNSIKTSGYSLFINNNDKLGVLFDVTEENKIIKKELVFN